MRNLLAVVAAVALAVFVLSVSSVASALTATQNEQILQNDLKAQQVAINDWPSNSPDETKEQQNWLGTIQIGLFSAVGIITPQKTQAYEGFYATAVQLEQSASDSLQKAQTAFAQGNYAAANMDLMASDQYLMTADSAYQAANGLWMGELTTAQSDLFNTCKAIGDITGDVSEASVDVATAEQASTVAGLLNTAESTGLHVMCDEEFGHSDETVSDVASAAITSLVSYDLGGFVDGSPPLVQNVVNIGSTVITDVGGLAGDVMQPSPPPISTSAIVSKPASIVDSSQQGQSGPTATTPQPQASPNNSSSVGTSQPASSLSTSSASANSAQQASQYLTAYVVDQFGNPVSGADFELVASDGTSYSYESYDFGLLTNADGYLKDMADQIPSGSYTYTVTQDGYDTYKGTAEISDGNEDLGKIVMQKWGSVSAIITDSSGNYPSYINFWLVDNQGSMYGLYPDTGAQVPDHSTDFLATEYNSDTGRVQIGPVPNGTYTLRVVDPNAETSLSQSVQVSGSDVFLNTLILH